MRTLLSFGIFIINGIISGIEFLTNALLSVLTFGRMGLGSENKVELPRFRSEIILEAYDQMKAVAEDGKSGAREIAEANNKFFKSFMSSFLTDAQFNLLKETSMDMGKGLLATLDDIKGDTKAYEAFVGLVIDDSKQSVGRAMKAVRDLMVHIEREAVAAAGRSAKFVSETSVAVYGTSRTPETQKKVEGFYNLLGITDKYNLNVLSKK